MEVFKASVQYGDMKGTVAADRHDQKNIMHYLEENGHLHPGEILAGISVSTGEIRTHLENRPIYVIVYLSNGTFDIDTIESDTPLQLRKIELDMQPSDFLSLFKRFRISLSPYGKLEGKQIITEQE